MRKLYTFSKGMLSLNRDLNLISEQLGTWLDRTVDVNDTQLGNASLVTVPLS